MKKPVLVIAALISVLALTGCGDDTDSSAASGQRGAEAPALEAEGGGMQETEPAAAVRYADEIEDADAVYLAAVRDGWIVGLDDVSDADFIAAGLDACAQLEAGKTSDTIDPIFGTDPEELVPGNNDASVAAIASQTLCPSFDVTKLP